MPRLGLTLAALFVSAPVRTSTTSTVTASFQVSADGAALRVTDFPEAERKRYQLFEKSCSRCHSLRWPIQALVKGRTPVTKSVFEEEQIRAYVIRMMRKRGSGIDKEMARELVIFLRYARARAREAQK